MEQILIYAALVFCALIILLLKLPKQYMLRVLGYEYVVDIAFFLAVKWLFFGTQGGMLIAFVSGLVFSLALHATSYVTGMERFDSVKCDSCQCHSRRWIYHPPRFTFKRQSPVHTETTAA